MKYSIGHQRHAVWASLSVVFGQPSTTQVNIWRLLVYFSQRT